MAPKEKEKASEELIYPDFWIVRTTMGWFTLSTPMAVIVRRAITRWPRPRWVSLVDIFGDRLMLKTDTITWMSQSSVESRSLERKFRKERDSEDPEESLGV